MASSFIQKVFWGSQLKKDQVGIFCLVKYDVVVEVRLCSPTTTATWQHPRWSIALFSFLLERLHLYYCSRIQHTYLPYNTASNKSNTSFTSSTAVWKNAALLLDLFGYYSTEKITHIIKIHSWWWKKKINLQILIFDFCWHHYLSVIDWIYWVLNSCNFESVRAK